MLREFIVLPMIVFFSVLVFLGEKWKEEHEKVVQLEKDLEFYETEFDNLKRA